ncbi:DUF2007 domain-containing protein [Alphaproteobacteria bacterium]|nr:DUF2007 domain-containing protein [Alphaproteobacteria bacterium]
MGDDGYVLLTTVFDQSIGHIIKGVLKTNDIECWVHSTNPAAVGAGMINIGIMVLKEDLDAAQALLQDIQQ